MYFKRINLEKIEARDRSIKEILEIIEEKFKKLRGDKKDLFYFQMDILKMKMTVF